MGKKPGSGVAGLGVKLSLAAVVVGADEGVLPWASVVGAAVVWTVMNPGLGVEGDGVNWRAVGAWVVVVGGGLPWASVVVVAGATVVVMGLNPGRGPGVLGH